MPPTLRVDAHAPSGIVPCNMALCMRALVTATVAPHLCTQAGDVLLLEAGPSFMKEHSKSSTFALVSPVEGSAPPRMNKLWVSLILLGAMIALYVANILPLSAAALWAAALMIATKCITVQVRVWRRQGASVGLEFQQMPRSSGEERRCKRRVHALLWPQEARRAIKWDVYIAISAAFGVSTALSNSGAATAIAKALGAWASTWRGNVTRRLGHGRASAAGCQSTAWADSRIRFPPAVHVGKAMKLGNLPVQAALYIATAAISQV